jgi:shikimate dehydrogenase
MKGENLPAGLLANCIGLLDMAYGPVETPAVRAAVRAGLPTAEGTEMLLAQAAVSFELWTGRPAPRAAMRAALQKAQATR